MAISFTRFSWWVWGRNEKEPVAKGAPMNSSSEKGMGMREADNLKFAPVTKSKCQSREQRRTPDKDYDVVLVPSDGESDHLDWSIGWLEPHAPNFQGDDEADNSFAVLVPCYRHACKELEEGPSNQLTAFNFSKLLNDHSNDGKQYVEQLLSSLQQI